MELLRELQQLYALATLAKTQADKAEVLQAQLKDRKAALLTGMKAASLTTLTDDNGYWSATAHQTRVYTVEDWERLHRYIGNGGDWAILKRQLHTRNCAAYEKLHGECPPGVRAVLLDDLRLGDQ